SLACILLISGLVPWFWTWVPMLSKVQFPWRLLVVVEFATITALCLLSWESLTRWAKLLFVAALLAAIPGVGGTAAGILERARLVLAGQSLPPQDVKEYLPAGFPQRPDAGFADLGLEPLADTPLIACTPQPRLCRGSAEPFGNMRLEVETDGPTTVTVR